MFGLSSLATYTIAGALIFASGAASGWRVEAWHWSAADAKQLASAAAQREAEEHHMARVSAGYEEQKEATRVVYRTITKRADPVAAGYADRACLDPAGLQLVNDALRGSAAPAGGPDAAVPGARPAR